MSHKALIQIGSVHACAHMHMESAQAHFLQHIDLPGECFILELSVPSPERCPAIFASGAAEKFILQRFVQVLRIQHDFSPVLFYLSAAAGIELCSFCCINFSTARFQPPQ